jgi:hypothetical protein
MSSTHSYTPVRELLTSSTLHFFSLLGPPSVSRMSKAAIDGAKAAFGKKDYATVVSLAKEGIKAAGSKDVNEVTEPAAELLLCSNALLCMLCRKPLRSRLRSFTCFVLLLNRNKV